MDLRYGLLSNIDKKLLYRIIDNDNYFDRMYDEFDYVNHSLFNSLYKNLNRKDLIKSKPTKILELIASEFLLMESKLLEANEMPILPLTVNTYPFTLSDKEAKIMSKGIKSWCLNDRIEIAFISLPPTSITFSFIADNFSIVIMYDYSKWIDYQLASRTGNAVATTLYVPAIMGLPIKVKKIQELETMFNAYSELFGAYIKMIHVPVETYCVRSNYKEKYLEELRKYIQGS